MTENSLDYLVIIGKTREEIRLLEMESTSHE